MMKRYFRLISLMTVLALLCASLWMPAAAEGADIVDFDTVPSGGWCHGFERSIDTGTGNSADGASMKLIPEIGYSLADLQVAIGIQPNKFQSDGVKFWLKSESKKVVLNFLFGFTRADGTKGTYAQQVVATPTGRWVVLRFEELMHNSGSELDVLQAVKEKMTYFYIKFYSTPIDTVYIDAMRNIEPGDVSQEPDYSGVVDETDTPDPDTQYTPGAEREDSSLIYNFSKLPGGFSKGISVVHNTNPACADAGYSVKAIPQAGTSIAEIQYVVGVTKGSFTGSGIKFWARSASRSVVLDVIIGATAEDGTKGNYSYQCVVDPTTGLFEVPFREFVRNAGQELNLSKAARANFCYVFFKFYGTPVDTFYLDSIGNLPYDENLECTDPVLPENPDIPDPDIPGGDKPSIEPVWELSWSDEFDGNSIDTSVWTYDYGTSRNGEIAYFTDRPENSYLEDGNLVIQTLKEDYRGIADYTSAELVTRNRKTFLYGKLEIRAKLPYGKGIWPAFWTLGASGAWPSGGEIDIFELVGGPTSVGEGKGDNLLNGGVHYTDANGARRSTGGDGGKFVLEEGNFCDDYHIIGMEWDPWEIRLYCDGILRTTIDITPEYMSEFHQPQYVLLNTSMGGSWAGNPDDTTVFPQKYYIDYIRYYVDVSGRNEGGVSLPYETDETLLWGISPESNTVSEFVASCNLPKNAELILKNGGTVLGDTDKVTTGTVVELYRDGIMQYQKTCVLYGDINKDGKINAGDLLLQKRKILGLIALEETALEAADTAKGGGVTSADLLMIKRHILGLAVIDQKRVS